MRGAAGAVADRPRAGCAAARAPAGGSGCAEGALAFEADEVHGSLRYPLDDVRAVPSTVAHAVARFATGVLPWGERRVGLLDADLLLHALDRRIS
ncbi:hypothetical protein FE772_12245 [Lysobacter enzymogenes]|nr:hypothetical protein [Lysobacter enzymogenes]QCW26320.1 hypothetical protein FE772_12245 [Lysobacter enzymogenes]